MGLRVWKEVVKSHDAEPQKHRESLKPAKSLEPHKARKPSKKETWKP